MRAIAGRVLIIVGLLAALSLPVSLTACGGSSNQPQGGTPATQSEEASENDSIESTREEEIEQQRGAEEASENDSIESTREEQIESSRTTP